MGVRAGFVVCVTSFLLGALFTHWIADSLTLWKSPVTEEHLWTAASYYAILANGPSELVYLLVVIAGLGATTILWSLHDLRADNIMFDGGSVFLFMTTVIMYLNSVVPSISSTFKALPPHTLATPIPRLLRESILELASNNLICSVALTGVLVLQACRLWVEQSEAEDEDDDFVVIEPEDVPKAAVATASASGTTSTGTTSGNTSKSRRPASSSGTKTPDLGISEDKVKPLLQARVLSN
ncbi:ER membrane protein SH3-domain-containing protein [Crepidotus variabilis]|uniref:ER membrane protein SH3-domain-containing protein n=1 Tax=Crepidotus variabilis TaxID=179855 RepID=A0A9P6EPX2_9AGAR|nr:ER membrane protein SH3-domain-containing protein [Crepidotus variabilis]